MNIKISLPETADVSIQLYNVLGQKVASIFEGNLTAGYHSVLLNNTAKLTSGVYFVKASSQGQISTQKVMFLK